MAEVLNQGMKVPLTKLRRDLMHRAMDDHPDLVGVMHILNGYKFCDNFLIWLIAHGFTGQKLADLIVQQFAGSVPALVNFIVEATGESRVHARKSDT